MLKDQQIGGTISGLLALDFLPSFLPFFLSVVALSQVVRTQKADPARLFVTAIFEVLLHTCIALTTSFLAPLSPNFFLIRYLDSSYEELLLRSVHIRPRSLQILGLVDYIAGRGGYLGSRDMSS